MKKLLVLFAVAAALVTVSCTQENLETVKDGQEVNVTFRAQLPSQIATKAYSDGSLATKLVYAVYNANSKEPLYDDEAEFVNGEAVIDDLVLITGKTYNLLFWAQSPDNETYAVSLKDQTMTVDYTKMLANDENNDAFYAFETFTVKGALNETVELYRPFAQVNVGTDDIDKSQDKSFKLEKTSMKARVANVLNFADGTVSGEADVEYAVNDVPSALTENFPISGYDTYLSMNYLLVGSAKTTTNCEFYVYSEGNNKATNHITVPNVPVQRNYRTNIYGSLLTDLASLKIEIVSVFDGEEDFEIKEADENTSDADFYTMLQEGDNVNLVGPRKIIDFRGLTIQKDLTLTLNAPVEAIYLGGNNENNAKSASAKPNIVIELAAGIDYPVFYANYSDTKRVIENYTLVAVPASAKVCTQNIQFGTATNVTFDGFKFEGNGGVYAKAAEGLTIKNCSTTAGYNSFFVRVYGGSALTLQNNTITAVNYDAVSSQAHDIFVISGMTGNIVIDGNKIDKSLDHHAVWISKSPEAVVTIKNNTISNTLEDAVKIDQPGNVTITGNTIVNAGVNAIRFDNFANDATLVVTGNTISTSKNSALETGYGIYLKKGEVNVNLTAKDNKVGESGIVGNRYFKAAETLNLSGDYEFPFPGNVADGVSLGADGKTYGISNVNGLKWLSDNITSVKNVKLTADIDLAGENWPSFGYEKHFSGTFDGCNHVIKNMSAINNYNYGNGFFYSIAGGSVKNVTFDNALVGRSASLPASGNIYGIVTGYTYGSVTFENVHVKNSNIVAFGKVGGIVGKAGESLKEVTTFKNCSVKNTTINGIYNVAGLAGLAQSSVAIDENCVVEAEWNAPADKVYEELDKTLTDSDANEFTLKGTFWKYQENYYFAGWAKYYTDYTEIQTEETADAPACIYVGLCYN